MEKSIEVKNLEKRYEGFTLGKIDLEIPAGEIIGLIGENGAGKTTFIKSILNIVSKDSGDIKIFDKDFKENEGEIKENIGAVLDETFFPELMNAKDINLVMKDIFKKWDEKLFNDYLKKFALPNNKPIKTFSKGMKKKLEIATALSHHPKLLILDEPTSGLDPVVRNEVLDIFLEFMQNEENTIIFSTHITSDLEHIADRIVFIDNGKILLNKSRDDIMDNYGILKCDIDKIDEVEKEDIVRFKKNKYNYEILVENKEKAMNRYKDLVVDKITLEDLMVLYIKGEK